ncbi:flagellar hook assembly protein FlgD [Holophaga foetida]|uniref:flagellar hook assembly protein FlgD n=1 Tax=Holophaga foetida TaxID=35839 RepID=UPI00024742DD|nr:flagellar hook assembly protein FlgD [Holophaga foetida]
MDSGLVTSSTSTAGTTGTSTTIKKELDKDAFLQLLVAQLQNQDPTQAQDPNQMVQQMTSFSALEQAQNTNTLLKAMQVQNQTMLQTQAVGLVGKMVEATTSQFDLSSGSSSMKLNLDSQADVKILIKDAKGNTVATLDKGNMTSGSHSVNWDGKDATGKALPDGTYTASVSAKNASGADVTSTLSTKVKVDSVFFNDGAAYIVAGGKQIALSDVTQIYA